ncbi:MAG: hypothetical protein AABY36_05130 [Campylobacterota bacterium]
MDKLKIIVLIGLGLFSIIYAYYFRVAIPQTSIGFFDGVVTTFVSTLLSIIVGIFLYEYQDNENKKSELKRLKTIVKAESQDIVSILSAGEGMTITLSNGQTMIVLITLISPLAHEEAGKSGKFNALVTENLFHISRKIRMYNMKVEYLLGLIQRNQNESYLIHAINNVNETKEAVIRDCNQVKLQITNA